MKNIVIIVSILIALASIVFAYTYKGAYYLESKSYGGENYIIVLQNGEAKGICKK